MRVRRRDYLARVIAATAVLSSAVSCNSGGSPISGSTPPTAPSFVAEIAGLVERFDGEPVAGAVVSVKPHGLSAVSAADGRFRFERLALKGQCQLLTFSVSADGFGAWRSVDSPVYANQLNTLEVALSDETVVDVVGAPLQGSDCTT